MVANILEIANVTKKYKDFVAVDDVSLNIPRNEIFGLLGPNGAGKTTLIRMITQIISRDQGQIYFDGNALQPSDVYRMGYMPEERGLYKKMKVGDHLIYLGELRGMPKATIQPIIQEWFDRLQIDDWSDKKIQDLSKGMQQKIQFISTVMHKPTLVILDEPFSGLDPVNANLIRDEIERMVREEGLSVIFSTHRMEQVEEICDYIALIDHGKMVLDGRLSDVKNLHKENIFLFQTSEVIFDERLEHLPNFNRVDDLTFTIQTDSTEEANKILKSMLDAGLQVTKFEEQLPTINEIFIKTVTS